MNPKPNLLGTLISYLQNNTTVHNNKNNDNDAINAEMTKLSSLCNYKILYDPAMYQVLQYFISLFC